MPMSALPQAFAGRPRRAQAMNALQPVCLTHPRPVIANRIARFVVPDMRTQQCTRRITAGMKQLDGIKSVRTNITRRRIVVQFEPQLTGLREMTAEIERAGCNVADIVQTGVTTQSREVQLVVSTMDCDYCADHVTRALKRLPGVLVVTTEPAEHRVTVRFAPEKVDPSMITAAVERAGYAMVG
jgi:copper chaperone CopZ